MSEEQIKDQEKVINEEELTEKTTNEAEVNIEDSTAEESEVELDPLVKLEIELQEQKDKFLRLYAEFENFKRRTAKERLELIKTAGQDVIRDLIPVMDDIDRAEKSMESAESIEATKDGFTLIKDKLLKNLENKGLMAMEAFGEEFNPDFHEAITKINAPSEDMIGKVVDVVEKGYTLNGKIIRYAKVVIGQ